ncbi:hypothetical protein A2867_02185 [Candidatus Daviesbacteria bacterium RIFCSPHIGHO2_01_FULL_40_11]|uniref:DUF5667 domain-containing protein n=1 Tax=Candidatus Daviesbacteria bacterium RIFCSPHIGHO2_01_FULL_40_11 TaxID=1797762 RepID=A0A1F5JLV9_9BACT|nr:MAG: hypothetical protein A2867_02185 [Candidatus Daviesbacteria bacterium RIFCSPHIGHO2_01_FULL_40_11]
MKKFSIKLALLFFTLSIFNFSLLTFPAYAQGPDIGYSRLHPASPFYFLKAIREKLEIRFAGTPRTRMLWELEFAERRLREARTLLFVSQDLIQSTLERYVAELNRLPDKHQEKDELGLKIKGALKVHLTVLEQMYPEAKDAKAKMAIRSAMNRVIQRADVQSAVKLPVCSLFSKEASSSALNEVERMVLAERAKVCLQGAI